MGAFRIGLRRLPCRLRQPETKPAPLGYDSLALGCGSAAARQRIAGLRQVQIHESCASPPNATGSAARSDSATCDTVQVAGQTLA
jgi:hypothetical protein